MNRRIAAAAAVLAALAAAAYSGFRDGGEHRSPAKSEHSGTVR